MIPRLLFVTLMTVPLFAQGAIPKGSGLEPSKKHTADRKKTEFYVRDGMVDGGDRAIDNAIVLGLRHANNTQFERIVVDLEGTRDGEPAAIARPPYYQVALHPEMKQVRVTFFGNPRLAFDSRDVLRNFSKSRLITKVEMLPLIEKDRWMFVLHLKENRPVEVFELTKNVRVILDFKR